MLFYQDYTAAEDRTAFLARLIRETKGSAAFARALEADAYFRGENPAIARKTVLKARKLETRDETGRRRTRCVTEDVVGNRIGSGFLYRFVCQQNQYLLQNGVTLPPAVRARLGSGFDRRLSQLGERALLQGVAFGYWNGAALEVLDAARGPLSGFAPLWDELTGALRAGVQFWQSAPERPLYARLFEEGRITLLRLRGDGCEVLEERACRGLPVIPLFANAEHRSELTPAIRAKIDAYDRILSDFADNLDRANDVYWVLNNFGGTTDDIAEMLAEISRLKAVANLSDGTGGGSTAEPHTIEVPYEARRTALELLEKALYDDYMALDLRALTGGSLTNVAIRAARANLDLKSDRYEWQVTEFLQGLLGYLGVRTEEIRFQRQQLENALETVQAIALARDDIDRRTALKLNPMLQSEEVDALCAAT